MVSRRVAQVQHQSFLFWWTPDSTFVEYDAVLVEMPPWNPSEQKQGILRSSMEAWVSSTCWDRWGADGGAVAGTTAL